MMVNTVTCQIAPHRRLIVRLLLLVCLGDVDGSSVSVRRRSHSSSSMDSDGRGDSFERGMSSLEEEEEEDVIRVGDTRLWLVVGGGQMKWANHARK